MVYIYLKKWQRGKVVIERRLLMLLTAVTMLLVVGCGSSMTDLEHIQKAEEYRLENNWNAAVIELKNALRQNPENAKARFLLGETYIFIRQGADAEKELRRALQGNFDNEMLPVYLGRAILYQDEYEKVIEEVTVSNDYSGDINAKLLAIRGDAFLGLDRIEDARQSYNQALGYSDDLSEALLGLAKVGIRLNDPDEVKKQIGLALDADAKNWEAWLIKAELSYLETDYKLAEESFKRVAESGDGVFWKLQGRLGVVKSLIAQKQEQQALNEIESLQEDFPNHPLPKFFRAKIAYNNSDFDLAKEQLLQVLKAIPDHKESLLLLGSVNYLQGNFEGADNYLSRFVAARPDNIVARKLLAGTRMQQNQPELAMEALRGALTQAVDDTQLMTMVGQVAMSSGDIKQSISYLNKALAVDPDNSTARINLGRAYLARGDYKKGIAELTKVLKSGKEQEKAGTLLVLAYIQLKDSKKALDVAKGLLNSSKDNPVYLNLVGVAYLNSGSQKDARSYFEKALKDKYLPAAINLARIERLDGDLDAASRRYKDILKWKPSHIDSMIALSQLTALQGSEQGAVEWLEKARKADTSAIKPRLLLGRYYLQKGDVKQAVTIAEEAVSSGHKSAEALVLLGQAQMFDGKPEQAISTYLRLVEENPESALAWFYLGRLQFQQNSLDEARHSLKKALRINPGFITAASTLVRLELVDKRDAAAIAVVRNLRKELPKVAVVDVLEGDLMMAQHKFPKAMKLFQKAFEKEKNGPLALKVFVALSRADQQKPASRFMEEWLEKDPGFIQGRLMLANLYQEMEQYDQAQLQYEYILERDENNAFALNDLAWMLHKKGDSKALAYAEKAARIKPENGLILDTLGWILVESGEVKRGEEILQKALRLAPGVPDIRYHLAVALVKLGKTDDAQKKLLELENMSASEVFSEMEAAKKLLERL